jgi:hypothetical protein
MFAASRAGRGSVLARREGDLDEQRCDGGTSADRGIPGSPGFLKVAVELGGDSEGVQGVGVFGSATEVAESFEAVGRALVEGRGVGRCLRGTALAGQAEELAGKADLTGQCEPPMRG